MVEYFINIDSEILLWIQDFIRLPILDTIMIAITKTGNMGAIWILITAMLLLFKKTRRIGLMSAMALLGSLIINNLILKNLVARTRPYEVISNLKLLVNPARDYSFPSGHTGSSFACAYILYKELPKKYGVPAIIYASLMGASRLYIGIHYPSDVICGAIIGVLIAAFVRKQYNQKL